MRQYILWGTLLVFAVAFLSLAMTVPFGNPKISDMDDYFLSHGQEQTGGNNIVTDVVFDFRGFDTLGEATVLFTAVISVGMLFRARKKEEEYDYE